MPLKLSIECSDNLTRIVDASHIIDSPAGNIERRKRAVAVQKTLIDPKYSNHLVRIVNTFWIGAWRKKGEDAVCVDKAMQTGIVLQHPDDLTSIVNAVDLKYCCARRA